MALRSSDLQSDGDLDSIRNFCDVLPLTIICCQQKILMALATPPRPPLMAKGQGGRIEDSFGISNVYCLIKHLLICMTLLPTEITPGSIQDALSK